MPFGLVSAPFTFSKFMAELLKGCEDFCVPYLDDVAIFSNSLDEHVKHLDVILRKIGNAKLKIKPSKCSLGRKTVKYLGHVVGNGIRSPVEAKIQAIVNFPAPKTRTEIRRLIGMIGYYSRYIKDYAKIVEPLTNALRGKNKREQITWTPECQKAFDTIKGKLVERPVLHAPDYSKPFIIQVDSSNTGTGVVLCQRDEKGEEHPILYLSRKFIKAELNYCTT
ncbi:Retrovirus-related Pol polyprotein from transposon 297 [Araneus ventricosus]|nr:Retrovirus-related Pol polyprotein from transposon 297 [Araneus ventricosus]